MVLKPLPAKVPVKLLSGPRLGSEGAGALTFVKLDTSPNLKRIGTERVFSSCCGFSRFGVCIAQSSQRTWPGVTGAGIDYLFPSAVVKRVVGLRVKPIRAAPSV